MLCVLSFFLTLNFFQMKNVKGCDDGSKLRRATRRKFAAVMNLCVSLKCLPALKVNYLRESCELFSNQSVQRGMCLCRPSERSDGCDWPLPHAAFARLRIPARKLSSLNLIVFSVFTHKEKKIHILTLDHANAKRNQV